MVIPNTVHPNMEIAMLSMLFSTQKEGSKTEDGGNPNADEKALIFAS